MKLGAERRKLALLGILLVIAAYAVYTNLLSDDAPASSRRRSTQASAARGRNLARSDRAPATPDRGAGFRLRWSESDEPLDPRTTDPTLRTDLLTRVRQVEFTGVERNLFQFGQRKKKEVAPPPQDLVDAAQEKLRRERERQRTAAAATKKKAAPARSRLRTDFKYYGFANKPGDTRKRAFLLDGEEVLIGGVGDIVKNRYRVVKIGVNSIEIEDVKSKDREILKLQES